MVRDARAHPERHAARERSGVNHAVLPHHGDADARERWHRIFGRFGTIVLVANSDAVDVATLRSSYGESTLFVFFNKVYKVLDRRFQGPCLLVARSGPAGANIVYRREVPDVLRLVDGAGFLGICNLRAGRHERFSEPAEFGNACPVGHLDCAADLADFYPSTHVATSGFALALFLLELLPESRIVLAGFTARRSVRWKLFADHDWTFEQIVQRLLLRAGRLQSANAVPEDVLSPIARRFPELRNADVASVAAEVVAERLEGANLAIDDLLRLTRPQRRLDDALRRLKPRTRKQKLGDAAGG